MLVAVDGEALLEGELEPVAACDAVSSPVVEVLVRNDALHAFEITVGGCGALGEDARGVEDIEPLDTRQG